MSDLGVRESDTRIIAFTCSILLLPTPCATLLPYTTLFRSRSASPGAGLAAPAAAVEPGLRVRREQPNHAVDRLLSTDRKSTRLNSSHTLSWYAGFLLKKKK